MMDVKKISEKGNTLELHITDSDIALINSLRRAIMQTIPTVAVENVRIYENTSVLFDEFLAHRLAMIPLKAGSAKLKGGEKSIMTLQKEGPCTVYSGDIAASAAGVEVCEKKIPLVKLKKGQTVKMEMDAIAGYGKEHVKWQPALVSYQEVAKIITDKECNLCKKCIENCSKGLLEAKGKKIVLKKPLECDLCGKCRDSCKENALNLSYDNSAFILRVESHGGAEAKEIILQAIAELDKKCGEFESELKKLK